MLLKTCCTECGRPLPQIKAPPAAVNGNTAEMTTAELYAYYKRTALVEDLRFFSAGTLSPNLRARAETLDKPTTRDLAALRCAWRTERQRSERVRGVPAIGSPAWNQGAIQRHRKDSIMSSDYNSFAAAAFGPVLAEVARDEDLTEITPALRRRAERGWNLTSAAMAAVVREAERILETERTEP